MALNLPNTLDCDDCDTSFEEFFEFPERVLEKQDIIDEDVDETTKTVTCPNCGAQWEATWEGWHAHDDAG